MGPGRELPGSPAVRSRPQGLSTADILIAQKADHQVRRTNNHIGVVGAVIQIGDHARAVHLARVTVSPAFRLRKRGPGGWRPSLLAVGFSALMVRLRPRVR